MIKKRCENTVANKLVERKDKERCADQESSVQNLLKLLSINTNAPTIEGHLTGKLTGINEKGEPLVNFPGNPSQGPIAAMSTVPINFAQKGRIVVLVFDQNDPLRPIITGVIRTKSETVQEEGANNSVEIDGEEITFTSRKKTVIRCGSASITMTREGKVIIKGDYVLSSSTGFNQIKGGAIVIN